MNLKKYVVEIGMGIDQLGQNPTKAAAKAVKDAVSRSCLAGLMEVVRLEDVNQMVVHVLVGCPHADQVDEAEVLKSIPFGQKEIQIVEGGLAARGIYVSLMDDTSDEIYVATAAVTVFVDMDQVLQAWNQELALSRRT
jgi:uncharacterized protein (TIGR02058 family)